MKPVRVAVIGAGAAGLVALRHLTARPETFEAVAFEQTGVVGGTWVYTERKGTDENGLPIHSSMYRNLKTNLPKEIMAFPDYPFDKSLPSFIGHEEVRRYLEDYTAHYSLSKYIQFFTCVKEVKPRESSSGGVSWDITTQRVKEQSALQTEQFDAVMVCNGHFSIPHSPDLAGLDSFKGTVMHSHDYRQPQDFTGQRVAVLGCGPSGTDVGLELAKVCQKVYLSHNKPLLTCSLPDTLHQVPGIASVKPNSVILRDGQEKEVDSIILCTGYEYNFPFLAPECAISIRRGRVAPLYKHLVHTAYTSLSFIGICNQILPFPLFNNQVKFFLSTLDGAVKLPSKADMDRDADDDFSERVNSGMPHHYAHKMGARQWPYNDDLADMGHFERLSPMIKSIYVATHGRRSVALTSYKGDNFEITGDNLYALHTK